MLPVVDGDIGAELRPPETMLLNSRFAVVSITTSLEDRVFLASSGAVAR